MEQFHVISILGASARFIDPSTSFEQARRELNRRTLRLHANHVTAWLLRAGVVLSIYLLGRFVVGGSVGGAMGWSAAFLAVYLAWFACKGHLMIQHDRSAKLYWLQNDAGNEAFSSDDPMIATMPVQDDLLSARRNGMT